MPPYSPSLTDRLIVVAATLLLATFGHGQAADWSEEPLPTSYRRLTAISMADAAMGWTGGRDGLLLEYDGASWSRVNAPLLVGDVVALELSTGGKGWVATYDIDTQQSWIFRFDGLRWLNYPAPLGLRVTSMLVEKPGNLWITVRGGKIIRFDGATWHETSAANYHTLLAMAHRPGTKEVWAVGEYGAVVRWNGSSWSDVRTPGTTQLNGLVWQGSDTLWAVGDAGTVLRWTNERWQRITSGTTNNLSGVSTAGDGTIWICGSDALLRWKDGALGPAGTPVHGDLRAIAMTGTVTGPQKGWAVGFGLMLGMGNKLAGDDDPERLRFYPKTLLPNLMGVYGLAVSDANGDGLDDIYVVSVRGANHLLINQGGGKFEDRTGPAGVAGSILSGSEQRRDYAALWVDINNDGRNDLVVAGWDSTTQIFIQRSGGHFDRASEAIPRGTVHLSANSVVAADVDSDGNLDLFFTNEHGSDQLLMGDGFGRFEDRTEEWGLTTTAGSQQAAFADADGDGDPDLYVCRWGGPNLVYRNDGGRFEPLDNPGGIAGRQDQSNGAAWADLDNDGDLDLIVTNAGSRNHVYRNDGNWKFVDVSGMVAFSSGPVSYGIVAADFDLDGLLDLYLINDVGATFFQNLGHWQFAPITVDGLSDIRDGRSTTWIDLDDDGDPDLITGSKTDLTDRVDDFRQRHTLTYLNGLKDPVALVISPRGVYSNRQGIGARIWVWKAGKMGSADDLIAFREISAGSGFMSQSPSKALIGAKRDSLYDIRVLFPSLEGTLSWRP